MKILFTKGIQDKVLVRVEDWKPTADVFAKEEFTGVGVRNREAVNDVLMTVKEAQRDLQELEKLLREHL